MLQANLVTTPLRQVGRIQTVQALTGLPRSTIYALIKMEKFPRPFKLVEGGQAVGWWLDEIEAYLEERASAAGKASV